MDANLLSLSVDARSRIEGNGMTHRRSAVAAILGFLVAVAVAEPTFAQHSEAPRCQQPPSNLQSNPALLRVFMSLASKSETIRRQCAAIADAPDVRVVLQYRAHPQTFARAHSTIERYRRRLVR